MKMGAGDTSIIIPEEIKPTNIIKIITYDLLIQKLSIKKKTRNLG
jgi:hypothetical protein